jgi:membrane protease YdiL (CAAX protease family)
MFPELLVGAALGFCMLCAMTGLLWSLGLYHVRPNHLRHAFDSFLFNSYLSGMLEELLFRAILLRILGRVFGLRWGLVSSALLFGAAHLGHCTWLAAVEIAINGGLVMGLSYMATGRLWMSVGLHTAWDFTEDSFLGVNSHNGFLLSTPAANRSDVLTGGAFGPDGSVLATIVGLLVIVLITSVRKRQLFKKAT